MAVLYRIAKNAWKSSEAERPPDRQRQWQHQQRSEPYSFAGAGRLLGNTGTAYRHGRALVCLLLLLLSTSLGIKESYQLQDVLVDIDLQVPRLEAALHPP